MAICVAYTNGANSNFKGVATLYGSGLSSYSQALSLGTAATFFGGLLSIPYTAVLMRRFSGSGLVPDSLVSSPRFLFAVAAGAVLTVMLATRLGLPVSTTHALMGGLVGAGAVGSPNAIDLARLWRSFVLPLAISPLLGATATVILVLMIDRGARRRSRRTAPSPAPGPSQNERTTNEATNSPDHAAPLKVRLGTALHIASAIALSGARGFSDVPKIAALMTNVVALGGGVSSLLVSSAMAVGGLLHARRVAVTMAKKLSGLQRSSATCANLVTAALVSGAGAVAAPVSTTHVAVGSIAGAGIAIGDVNRRVVHEIVLAWTVTLPLAAVAAAVLLWLTSAGPHS